MRLIKVTALAGVLVVAGSVISARAQKIYVADNGTRSINSGWNVKVFENGVHKYIIGDNEGVTFSPRSVGFDSTGAVYVMHLSPTPSNINKIEKFSENADGTAAFAHSQVLTWHGGIGGIFSCVWGAAGSSQIDVDLSDDTVILSMGTGVWNTSCPSPGGRSGPYGNIVRFDGANPSVIDSKHTHAVAVQGLAWLNVSGARTPQSPTMTIDQSNGDVYVGSQWGDHALETTQAIERFSKDMVQLDFWDVNDPARGVPGNVTNVVSQGLAVTSDGSVWFSDVTGGAGMGGWGHMGVIVKFDSTGQFVTRRSGTTVMSGTARNNFQWTGGMDVDEHDVLYYADTDRVLALDSDTGDFMGFPLGDTTGQWDTNVYGPAAFSGANGSLSQISIGPEPAVGTSFRIR